MLSITKLQNLKAIHNAQKAQEPALEVVINHKTTKFESNSQPNSKATYSTHSCYQSQNYKIWKQFTTNMNELLAPLELLSIAKLQNLKAIHNYLIINILKVKVVINRKTTKFESNSQHSLSYSFKSLSCYQSQNYKIWKQFTTLIEEMK